jgi:hypothetical protein
MAVCEKCGGKLGLFGGCSACEKAEEAARIEARREREEAEARRLQQEAQQKAQRQAEIAAAQASVLLTTEHASNLQIKGRLGIVMSSVECVLDIKVPKAKGELLDDLKAEAVQLGGNAVVGVNIEFVETYAATIGVGDFKKFKMVAYGTAVIADL